MSLSIQQIESIKLLSSGCPQNETAQRLGVTPRTLQRWAKLPEYKAALGAITTQATEEAIHTAVETVGEEIKDQFVEEFNFFAERQQLRLAECNLLNTAQAAIMNQVKSGDLRAIAALLKISERRSKLLGLDVAVYPLLKALEMLLIDEVATKNQGLAVARGIEVIREDLKRNAE